MLNAGDWIIYRSAYFGWQVAEVLRPNAKFITGVGDERVFHKRVEGVARDKIAAQRACAALQDANKAHYAAERAERRRYLDQVAAIIAEASVPF